MSKTDKILLALLTFSTLILSLVFVIIISGLKIPIDYYQIIYGNYENQITAIVIGIIIFVLSLRFFLWAIRPSKYDFKEAIVNYGELGEMGISLNAIEDLVVRAANQVNGVKEVKPRIKISQDSTSIILNVIILPDNNIPELMQNLQQTVNKYIIETAGLKVSDIKIHIKSIYGSKTRRVE